MGDDHFDPRNPGDVRDFLETPAVPIFGLPAHEDGTPRVALRASDLVAPPGDTPNVSAAVVASILNLPDVRPRLAGPDRVFAVFWFKGARLAAFGVNPAASLGLEGSDDPTIRTARRMRDNYTPGRTVPVAFIRAAPPFLGVSVVPLPGAALTHLCPDCGVAEPADSHSCRAPDGPEK